MNTTKVVSVSDVLAEAGGEVHGNCSKAALHQVPKSRNRAYFGQGRSVRQQTWPEENRVIRECRIFFSGFALTSVPATVTCASSLT